VIVVGAGQCGLATAFALMRRRITNIKVLESQPPGRQGPWNTFGRMLTLRSPKHVNGPDLDVPSLTCESWYRARYGDVQWEALDKVPKEDWQDYLLWFQQTVGIPVDYHVRVESVDPGEGNLLRVRSTADGREQTHLARKVVFATGVEGTGQWRVPEIVSKALPRERYTQVAEDIDFGRFRGAKLGVLGGGASAYDNAATALEQGAGRVDLFFRRERLHRVNRYTWTEFSGFFDHFRDLPDEWRWRFMNHILPLNEPPPPDTFLRATRFPAFQLHLGETWDRVEFRDGEVIVCTQRGTYRFGHVLIAIGAAQDVKLHAELAHHASSIARWKDRFTPPPEEKNESLAQAPYLGPHFEYVERAPGSAPFLRHIHNFTAAATVSHGPSGSSVQGMKQAAQRIATGICRELFVGEVEGHFQELLDYDVPELDVPWPSEREEQQVELKQK
jgi:cation diffusion facilitator CzcD-associated flavoprotein CzcO